jgi:hypothetical protein
MNKEFNRMQKLAGLITENMEGTDLDSTASDVYDYFSKMSSSTSTDRRNYIKDTYGLSDDDAETVMMKVTDMMMGDDDMREGVAAYEYEKGKKAGNKNNFRDPIELAKAVVGKHGQELKSSKDLSPREFESKALMYASKMMKEAGMEKVVMTNLFIDEDWPSDYISKVSELLRGMSGKEMDMEEGLNKLVREMKKEKNTDVLRKKIREMILAEMDGAAVEAEDYDPVAEAKKDKEEEVEDIDIDVTDEKMVGNDDPKVAEIQDLLNQLQDAAEELGDEKLLTQVGNTITFFTREHVANADNMG